MKGIRLILVHVLCLGLVGVVLAQEVRWKELDEEARQLWKQGKYAEGVSLAAHALEVAEKTFDPNHPVVAFWLNSLAGFYVKQGKYSDAEPLYKRSLLIREKAFGPDHPKVASALHDLGNLYSGQGKYSDAEPLYKRSLAIWEKKQGDLSILT